jgi:hypothetical protein
VLYYDNRNVLAVLKRHVDNTKVLNNMLAYTLKKGLYYTLVGKPDLGRLHREAVIDFLHNQFGKKNLTLQTVYRSHQDLPTVFDTKKNQKTQQIKRVLIAFTLTQEITRILHQLLDTKKEIQLDFLLEPGCKGTPNLPGKMLKVPAHPLRRWYFYLSLRNQYDLVIQSDYRMLIALSWLNAKLLFINNEGFCLNDKPRLRDVWRAGVAYLKVRLFKRI